MSRKEMKRTARGVIKKHYLLFVFIILISALLGTRFTNAIEILSMEKNGYSTNLFYNLANLDVETESNVGDEAEDEGIQTTFGLDGAYKTILDYDDVKEEAEEKLEEDQDTSNNTQIGQLQIGHQRGVLAAVVNQISSGSLLVMLCSAIFGIAGEKSITVICMILGAFIVYMIFWIFVGNAFTVVMNRIFVESRIYQKIPTGRFIYLIRIKKWRKVALAIFKKSMYEFLWGLTLVGGVIKHYSYFCVPYILAENPNVSGKEAILMSRKMMDGHKFECFKLELSFLLWDIIDIFAIHLIGLFYLYPYKMATYTEYYVQLRNSWIAEKKENYEVLNDKYLFEKADEELLRRTYADIAELNELPPYPAVDGHPVEKFLAKNFGIIFKHNDREKQFLLRESMEQRRNAYERSMKGLAYPSRLSPIPEKEKRQNMEGVGYLRCYTISSLILIFFSLCFGGWLFEVTYALIESHKYINRGVLHGYWLPIYGMGGLIILILLYRLRKKPALTFFFGMILAGIVEYSIAWELEMTHGGEKWWDYSGYFLNLHGRICAEGLLTFGIGGLAVVYALAPMLDNIFRKIPKNVTLVICVILLVLYTWDNIYSAKHPNKGAGITDVGSTQQNVVSTADNSDHGPGTVTQAEYSSFDGLALLGM